MDNKKAISLAKNPVHHARIKHIDMRDFIRVKKCVANKEMQIRYSKSLDQVAEIFTKPLQHEIFQILRDMIGVTKSSLRMAVKSKLNLG